MRRYFWILLLPFLFSGCLRNLEKEGITAETIYKGRVIDKDAKPLNGIMVRITNGSLIYNSVTTDKDGLFQITVDINKIDKTYYIQIGDEGTLVKKSSLKGFGQDVYDYGDIPFININLPEVETLELTDMTPNTFTCKCNVKSEGGASLTERGVCWSTNIPTISDNKEKSGTGAGIYTCIVNSATFNFDTNNYYARAYAINEYGVAYGEAIEITPSRFTEFMKDKFPTVETVELADMTEKSFTCRCNVKSQGGSIVFERGLCWSTKLPTIEDEKEICGVGEGAYTCIVNRETIDFNTTTYYARAYAINEYGTSYGELIEMNSVKLAEFNALRLPTVETVGLTAMTSNSFTCKCNVKSQGKAIVTERGICWSTNIPTIEDQITQFGGGEGVYSCTVTNLDFVNTTYYVRAYAINEYGVAYGEPVEVNSSRMAYFSLPTMEYGGYTYHIHPDMGGMQWQQGYEACENLVAYGFDDWFMPNKEEMLAIAEKDTILQQSYIYWTCSNTVYDNRYWYIMYKYDSGWLCSSSYDSSNTSHIHNVIPVRKDR